MHLFIRFLIVIAFGIISFFPHYGLAWLAVWLVVFSLILPISLNLFRIVSTVAILSCFGILVWAAKDTGFFSLNYNYMVVPIVIVVFTVFGWLMIATPIWRSTRGIVAVQDQHPTH